MINATLNEMFSEILSLAICVDGVWYAPIQESLSTLFTCALVTGVVFGFIWAFVNHIVGLIFDGIRYLIAVRKARQATE